MDLAQPERECVLSNAAVFAQLERVPRVISAGSRVWHCRAQLQCKPAEESLDASLSLSFPFQKQVSQKREKEESTDKTSFQLWEDIIIFSHPNSGVD